MDKTRAYEVLLLTSLCVPDDVELKKQMHIAKIIESSEYLDLSRRVEFKSIYDGYFKKDMLSKFDVEKLISIEQAIKILPAVLTELIRSIQNGYGSQLTSTDKPDFYNADQLKALLKKLEAGLSGKNISNIDPTEFILLFDDSTLRSAEAVYMQLPLDADFNFTDVIFESFPDKKFCVSLDEMNSLKMRTDDIISKSKLSFDRLKSMKVSRLFIKVAVILIFVAIPIIMLMFGILPTNWLALLGTAMGVISILYLFLG